MKPERFYPAFSLFKLFLFLIPACFFSVLSFSQDYLVRQYTEVDGLPSSNVYDIAQDSCGCMWFASRGGIALYDGFRWERFSMREGLPVSPFSKIAVDRHNRVWALSEYGQHGLHVICFDRKKWKDMVILPGEINTDEHIASFALLDAPSTGKEGMAITIAIGTRQKGILLWNGSRWDHIDTNNGLLSNYVNGLLALDGRLYTATEKGLVIITPTPEGPTRVDHGLNNLIRASLPGTASSAIKAINIELSDRFEDSTLNYHRIWLYGGDWLGFIENGTFHKAFYKPSFNLSEYPDPIGIFPDYLNGVFISSLHRIYYYNYRTGSRDPIGAANGLIDEGAHSIFIDFEKNVWIACRRGVSKIASRRFANFQMKHGLLEDEVTAVLEYSPGKFILGHNNGLTFYDSGSPNPFVKHPFPNGSGNRSVVRRVIDMMRDSSGNTWIARYREPLLKCNKELSFQSYGPDSGLDSTVFSIWGDPDDSLWVGTSKGVFIKKANNSNRFSPLAEKDLKTVVIRKIYRPKKDWQNKPIIFATAGNGVYSYLPDRLTRYHIPDSPDANDIYSVFEDSKGRLFIGTLAGLYNVNAGVYRNFVSGDFRIDRPVYFIVEDSQQRLWFGTDNGVIRWDGDGKRVLTYSTAEGLTGLETNRAAGVVDSLGRLWIGTNRGVSIYNPSFDNLNFTVPHPRLELLDIEVPGNTIPLPLPAASSPGNTLQLPSTENNLGFHYRGISFLDESRLRFQGMLEGFEDQWSEELNPFRRTARYRNLPPGKYRFHLKVKNAQGIWSAPVTSPDIVILRPFYRKWWFYLAITLLAALLLTAVYRTISREKYSALLAGEIQERTRQLKVTEEKYAALFEDIKDAVFISSPDGKLMDMNPAGIEFFGFNSKEEILDVDIAHDLYADARDRIYFKKAIEEHDFVKDYEIPLKRKNGELRRALMTASTVRDERGEVMSYRGILRDITEKKKLEKQLERAQKMEAIGMLAGGVAHDLNNILTGLTSYPELLLLQIPQDSPLRRPLTTIKQTGEKAAAMVQDLLTLSRRGVEVREVINLNGVISDYLESPECEKLKSYHPDAQFDIHLAPDLLAVVGSPIHLFKTVMNLVSNAVEAMPTGGLVRISTENRYVDTSINGYDCIREGEYALLSVTDTGVGISPEDISRIFEPFYTRKEMGRSGTGLGMSVVWATIKDHSGYIDIKSQKGQGTSFDLYFPVTRRDIDPKASPEPIEKYMGRERILVIDDVEEQREVAMGILTQLGYSASTVPSGEEAIEYLRHTGFDLLIIDMIMEKGIDGLETYRRILHNHPGQKAIIVSGFSKTEKVKEMQRLGAGIYVKKPYTIEQIGRAIRRELDAC